MGAIEEVVPPPDDLRDVEKEGIWRGVSDGAAWLASGDEDESSSMVR